MKSKLINVIVSNYGLTIVALVSIVALLTGEAPLALILFVLYGIYKVFE